MLKWVRGFIVGILLGIIALEGGVIAVQLAIVGGYKDSLERRHYKQKYRSYY